MIAGVAALTSCLKDNDDEGSTAYSDMAVTQFTLGTLNRYTYTTSSKTGNDTIIKSSVTGSNYQMTIDQLNYRIYNTKELPAGTDVKHVICTISTKNSGVVALQSMTSDSLQWFSASDSIDFSVPRTFRIYATDGSGYRDYKVSVNVSSDKGTTFAWTNMGTMELPTDNPQLVATGDTVMVGRNDGVYTATNTAYTIDANDGLLKSSLDGGLSWQTEALDDVDSLLPAVGKAVFVSWSYAPADNTDYVLMVGTPRQDDVQTMRVWRKIAPYEGGGRWVYMPFDDTNRYPLPRQEYLAIAYYEGMVFAIGGDGILRQSRDQGISWHTNSTYNLPDAMTGEVISMAADNKERLWVLTSTGQLWRGSLK